MASFIERTFDFVSHLPVASDEELKEKDLILQGILERLEQYHMNNPIPSILESCTAGSPQELSVSVQETVPMDTLCQDLSSLVSSLPNEWHTILDRPDNDIAHLVDGMHGTYGNVADCDIALNYSPQELPLPSLCITNNRHNFFEIEGEVANNLGSGDEHESIFSDENSCSSPSNTSSLISSMGSGQDSSRKLRKSRGTSFSALNNAQLALRLCADVLAISEQTRRSPIWHNLSNERALEVLMASEQLLRPDAMDFIESRYRTWHADNPLWQSPEIILPRLDRTGNIPRHHERLATAYFCVNALDARNEDDQIRTRLAQVVLRIEYLRICGVRETLAESTVEAIRDLSIRGRGRNSQVIDDIIDQTRGTNDMLDSDSRQALRARFHQFNRLGKRYLQLARSIGPAILLLASRELIAVVKKPTFTNHMLELLIRLTRLRHQAAIDFLQPLNGFAQDVMEQKPMDNMSNFENMIHDMRAKSRSLGYLVE